MSGMMVGVISYLPDDTTKRAARLQFIERQWKWLSNLFSPEDIYVVFQNFGDDLVVSDGVHAIVKDTGIGPAAARNILLDIFYTSSYDWMLSLDDDIMSYKNIYEVDSLYEDLINEPTKFRELDMINGIFPQYQPYKNLNNNEECIIHNYTFVPRMINSGGGFIILRNSKHNRIYYRTDIDMGKFEGREDMQYLVDCIRSGLRCYTCNQLILDNMGSAKSTIFDWDTQVYKHQVRQCMDAFLSTSGINRTINGTIDWKSFNLRYNKAKEFLMIPRKSPIQDPKGEWFVSTPKKQHIGRRLF